MKLRGFLRLAAGILLFSPTAFGYYTSTNPIVLDRSETQIWAVNPDNNTVSVVDINAGDGTKGQEITVGREPQAINVSKDNTKIYVANAVDGTVSVIDRGTRAVVKTIKVGTEPWGLAITPNGRKLYVSNSGSGSVTVIDTSSDTILTTIFNVGEQPRAMAISDDKDTDDNDERVYVAWFLAVYRSGSPADVRPAEDNGKVGRISVISVGTDKVTKVITLEPIADTGFRANGDAINKVPPVDPAAFTQVTGAFPNIIAGMTIKGERLYVPATGSSPNGPVRFNVILQSLMYVVDIGAGADTVLADKTVNFNRGVQFESNALLDNQGRNAHRFMTNPYDFAIRGTTSREGNSVGYLVSAASDMIVKVDISANDTLTINPPPAAGQVGNIERLLLDPQGANPRAMVINSTDTFGYVWNYVSRNVTVVSLTGAAAAQAKVLTLADQPAAGTAAATIQRGKLLFNTGIGPAKAGPFTTGGADQPLQGVMADNGWCACSSCHPNGLTDGVVWGFPSGPRLSTPLNATFAPNHTTQRALNWSAIFDEVSDFELNTRGVAGGRGLILNADNTQAATVAFTTANTGRNADRDSITAYVANAIRTPISPVPQGDVRAAIGRRIFIKAGCATCHGGANWSTSRLEFTPPPPGTALVTEQGTAQLIGQLKQVGTFDSSKKHEVIGTGANISKQALGASGFNEPSLRGIHALGPYLHDGSAVRLGQALLTSAHVGSASFLQNPVKRSQLVQFLNSIDDSTPVVPVP